MTCADERRRSLVRSRGRNGIDAVSVSDDRRQLTVVFFGRAPEGLRPGNFRVDGGERITGITVTAVVPCGTEDPELEDTVRVSVDRAGDLSTYRLTFVDLDGGDVDPRYSGIDFHFGTGCDDLDCAPVCECPPPTYPSVEIDYLAKDYASFRQLLLDRLTLTVPQWRERHVPDIGIALVELLAYEGDRLSYLQDAVATEAYLNTARLRTSVRRHARLVDYRLHDGCAARAWVHLQVSGDVTLDPTAARFTSATEIFEPVGSQELVLWHSHNEITLWTWGDHDCCLPVGATSATLVDGPPDGDRALHLQPGDVVIFEELVGARTGVPTDRDATHRQAVRLVAVTHTADPLFDQPLLEVRWGRADALRFPLCVNTRGGPHCTDIDVAVARGNIVLVEHGETVADEQLAVPAREPAEPGCPDPDCFGCREAASGVGVEPYPPLPQRFAPRIAAVPLTHSTPFPPPRAACEALIEWLRDLPRLGRQRIAGILKQTARNPISQDDATYLRTLFGDSGLARVDLAGQPGRALAELLDRFDELLETKLARLDQLTAGVDGGCAPSAEREGWEILHSWGIAGLDPTRPRFFGSAAEATRTDPRTARPDIIVVDRFQDTWTPRPDLLDSGPDDRHFVAESDDGGHMHLRFGDGRNGARFALLEPGDDPLEPATVARYRIGNGAAGNVGADAIDGIALDGIDGAGITCVRNPIPASGGVEPETVAEARIQAPQESRQRRLRAITAHDYAELAGRTAGVQRAAANLVWTGSWYEAQVAIDATDGPPAPRWVLDDVRRSMHRYRRIGHDLAVCSAELVPLYLELCVQVRAGHVAGAVRAALLARLGSGRDGFFNAGRLTFGTPIRISALVAAAVSVAGVLSADVAALDRMFGPPTAALATGVLALGPLEVAQLDNDPSRPERGQLRLNLVGGR